MIYIEVQPHADGVGGHEVIHLAILVHIDLSIPRSRAERAHHHSRPTLLTADKLGDCINILNREPDDGAARAHAADLLLARIDQL